ncbi:hypothetical protein [uncultured Kordia sp.]|nr:hypothetical protein [uncultured Kordia sp.]
MKKKQLNTLNLNKQSISTFDPSKIKGGGHTQLATNCPTNCISCHDPR